MSVARGLYPMSLEAASMTLSKLRLFLSDVEKEALDSGATPGDWYATIPDSQPGVRIWHRDGWSPGFFTTDDDQVVFHEDYKE